MKLKIVIYILFIVCSFLNAETLKEYNGNKVEPQENILNELPYNSKGKYYQLVGKVIQRIDENSMLVSGAKNISTASKETIIYVEGILKGTFVTKGDLIDIVVKGDGEYR